MVFLKVGEGLWIPDLGSFHDFWDRWWQLWGMCVLGTALENTGTKPMLRNMDVKWEGLGSMRFRWDRQSLRHMHWGLSKPLSRSWAYRVLNTISFLKENGDQWHFTSGYDEGERQSDAKEEFKRGSCGDTLNFWFPCRLVKDVFPTLSLRREEGRPRNPSEEISYKEGHWGPVSWDRGSHLGMNSVSPRDYNSLRESSLEEPKSQSRPPMVAVGSPGDKGIHTSRHS